MRIVSQNGRHDINYDHLWVLRKDSSIEAHPDFAPNAWFITLGKYESEKRCKEIMAQIRQEYFCAQGNVSVYHMPEK